ncbi:MAG: hypothetical protein FJ295_09925 [Planctomycetes bacterium]|nr:hypothetical protein [Planctomycetota bacterium]
MIHSASNLAPVFYSKMWYRYVGVSVTTTLAVFSSVLGPLYLFDILKRADGRPGTDAGIALSIMAGPFCSVALLGWFDIHARRKPLLRICKEGLELNVIGASSLDGVPLVPPIVRLMWLILTLQGFKKQTAWIPWETLRSVNVVGLPMVRSLLIDATLVYPTFHGDNLTAKVGDNIGFRDAEFQDPLESIAAAILYFGNDRDARDRLPSLGD